MLGLFGLIYIAFGLDSCPGGASTILLMMIQLNARLQLSRAVFGNVTHALTESAPRSV